MLLLLLELLLCLSHVLYFGLTIEILCLIVNWSMPLYFHQSKYHFVSIVTGNCSLLFHFSFCSECCCFYHYCEIYIILLLSTLKTVSMIRSQNEMHYTILYTNTCSQYGKFHKRMPSIKTIMWLR